MQFNSRLVCAAFKDVTRDVRTMVDQSPEALFRALSPHPNRADWWVVCLDATKSPNEVALDTDGATYCDMYRAGQIV